MQCENSKKEKRKKRKSNRIIRNSGNMVGAVTERGVEYENLINVCMKL